MSATTSTFFPGLPNTPAEGSKMLLGTTPAGEGIWVFHQPSANASEPTRIHVASKDARILPSGDKVGFHLILEGMKQTSADFNPRYFNAFARALEIECGTALPTVPEFPRHLAQRIGAFAPKTVTVYGRKYRLEG